MPGAPRDRRWIVVFLALGLAVSSLMVARGQVALDQLNHLARGWQLAFEGTWVPFGPPATGGGAQPGGITALLTGLPLLLWEDHRAPAVLLLLLQLVGYLLLDRLVRTVLGPEERFLFALVYWLNPWRLYFSGFLWNPNYIFLFGALHLWTAWRLRREPRFWSSCLHVLALGVAIQLHTASLILIIASGLLWWRRYLRLRTAGALLGAALVALSLVPWALAVAADPRMLPASGGFPGRGLATVYPIVQGFLHWLRFPGIALSRSMTVLDLGWLGGPGFERLGPLMASFRLLLLVPTLVLSGWANWRLWRAAGSGWRKPLDDAASDGSWLQGYTRWCFLAAIATFALAPISVTHWYVFPVFHAAVLPLVLAGGELLRSARSRVTLGIAWVYAAIVLALGPALALGAPPYRCGEPRGTSKAWAAISLRADHPMLDRLGIQRTCALSVDDRDGIWPAAWSAVPTGEPR